MYVLLLLILWVVGCVMFRCCVLFSVTYCLSLPVWNVKDDEDVDEDEEDEWKKD